MNKMLKFNLSAVALSVGLLAHSADAAIVQVFSDAQLTQGPYVLETFDDLALEPGVTASASSGLLLVGLGLAPSFPSGTTGLSTLDFPDPITFTFATPASSVGMFFGNDDTCCASGFDANLDIFGTGGLIGTISVTANMNDSVDQFIGFISNEMVTAVTLRYGSGSDVGLYTVIDDLRFNNAAAVVPVPASLPLLASALGVVAVWRRRKA